MFDGRPTASFASTGGLRLPVDTRFAGTNALVQAGFQAYIFDGFHRLSKEPLGVYRHIIHTLQMWVTTYSRVLLSDVL